MTHKRKKILVVIPVYNEEKTLKEQVIKLSQFLSSQKELLETLHFCIADNGSTDKTRILSTNLANEFKWLSHAEVSRKGVGRALQETWQGGNFTHFGYMDLDFSTDLMELHKVIEQLDKYSLVIGSRFLPESKVSGRALKRKIASFALNGLCRKVFASNISDLMCGFKFIEANTYTFISRFLSNEPGWFYCAELVLVAELKNTTIKEIPIVWRESEESKVKVLKLSHEFLRSIIQLKKRLNLQK